MPGDIKPKYPAASTVVTVTNLHSLASDSGGYLTGWSSVSVSNLVNAYRNYMYGGTFTSNAANRVAGRVDVYVVGSLNDTPLFPATATGALGTEGLCSFVDTEERDSICRLLMSLTFDTSASAIQAFSQTGIAQFFDGMPTHHCLWIAQNLSTTTTAGLAAAGSALYYTPTTDQYT